VSEPIDLSAVRAACAGLVACYERFLAGGGLDLVQLNAALAAVRHLPRLGGGVGRALCLLARGGCDASTEETIAALEVLRRAPGLRALPAVPRERQLAMERPRAAQPTLPGLG
jgi:hypothetical protein